MSWVLRDLDPWVTANCTSKLQTLPLVRQGAPQHEDRKCPIVIEIYAKTNWQTVCRQITWTWTELESIHIIGGRNPGTSKNLEGYKEIECAPVTWTLWVIVSVGITCCYVHYYYIHYYLMACWTHFQGNVQYSNQSELTKYNSGVRLPLPT
jgi:hypothetical protein